MNPGQRPNPAFGDHRSRTPGRPPSGSLPPPPPAARGAPAPPRPAHRQIGPYAVIDTLGRGGMGVVHRCRDAMGREVALKTITSAALGRLDARLRREAQAISRLRHQNIVGLIAVGEDEGRPYLVMDLVHGEALDATLKRNGPLPPARAAAIVRDVSRALEHAHAHGVIHRDVKPANILMDGHGEPRLTDFGLAADTSAATQLTATGQMIGTLQYMAPEQADGERSSHGPHTDVWAAGAVLYACLTGRAPFDGGAVVQILKKVLIDDPVAPRKIKPWIPEGLERVVLRCLEKEPASRWPSAKALADALEPFALGEEVPDAITVERRPLAIGAAAIGLAVLGLALGYAWVGRGGVAERPPEVAATREGFTGHATTAPATDPQTEPATDATGPALPTRPPTAGTRDPSEAPSPPPSPAPPAADPETVALIAEGEAALERRDAVQALALGTLALERDDASADAMRLYAIATGELGGSTADVIRAVSSAFERYQARIDAGRASARDHARAAEMLLLDPGQAARASALIARALSAPLVEQLTSRERAEATALQVSAFLTEGNRPMAFTVLSSAPPGLLDEHEINLFFAKLLLENHRLDEAYATASRYAERVPENANGWTRVLECLAALPLELERFRRPLHALTDLAPDLAIAAFDALEARLVAERPGAPFPRQIREGRARAVAARDRSLALASLWAEAQSAAQLADPDEVRRRHATLFERYEALEPTVAHEARDLGRMGYIARYAERHRDAVRLLTTVLVPEHHAALGSERWLLLLALVEALRRVPGPDEPAVRATLALDRIPPAEHLPNQHAIRLRRATLELELGRADDALETIDSYLGRDPTGWRLAVNAHLAREDHEAVARVAARAIELGHDGSDLRTYASAAHTLAGRYARARLELDHALAMARTPQEREQANLFIVGNALDRADAATARATLDRLTTPDSDPRVRDLRALLGDLENGGPDLAPELVARGTKALRSHDAEAARQLAEAANHLDAAHPDASWLLYRALNASERTAEANDAAREALRRFERRPDGSARTLARRAELSFVASRDRIGAEARELFEAADRLSQRALARVAELDPADLWDAYFDRAYLLWHHVANLQEKGPEAGARVAVEFLEGVEHAMPDRHRVRVFYAAWLGGCRRGANAMSVLRAYVALEPEDEIARGVLDRLEREVGGGPR